MHFTLQVHVSCPSVYRMFHLSECSFEAHTSSESLSVTNVGPYVFYRSFYPDNMDMWRTLVCQMCTIDHFDQLLTVNRKSLKIPNDNLCYSLESRSSWSYLFIMSGMMFNKNKGNELISVLRLFWMSSVLTFLTFFSSCICFFLNWYHEIN